MPDSVEGAVKRYCGDCPHRDEKRDVCLLNLAYSAFVYPWSLAGDCACHPAFERAAAERGIYDAPEVTP